MQKYNGHTDDICVIIIMIIWYKRYRILMTRNNTVTHHIIQFSYSMT